MLMALPGVNLILGWTSSMTSFRMRTMYLNIPGWLRFYGA